MHLTKSQKQHMVVFNIIVPFLVGLGIDLYVPSLPSIAQYFHVTKHLIQLSIAMYMLGYGAGQFFLGILSDSVGRRIIFLTSIFFFTTVSFIMILSPNAHFFDLCRFLQGIGLAGIGVTRRAIVTDCFSGLELTKAMSLIATSWALGPIIGPFIGGYLQHYFNWQANFYFYGCYGLIILLYALFYLPETNLDPQKFVPKRVFKAIKSIIASPVFILGVMILALVYSALIIFNIIGPFLIQITLKYSVIAYGNIALGMGFAFFAGNIINRILIQSIKPMHASLIGLITAIISSGTMLILSFMIPINLYIIIIPSFLLFSSCGMVYSNIMAKCMGLFPKLAGTASALFGVFIAAIAFLISTYASFLKINSQIPMAISYIIISIVCLGLFFCLIRNSTKNIFN